MIDNYELYHHGVKGMRWGVRHDKEKYGMSKREVKSAIRKAKRNYRRNEDPYHLFSGTTGKNVAKVRSDFRKAVNNDKTVKDYKSKRDSAYDQARSHDMLRNLYSGEGKSQKLYDYHTKESEKYQIKGNTYNELVRERTTKIGKNYTQKYNDALLKDIGYKGNIDTGREMLNKYGITKHNRVY